MRVENVYEDAHNRTFKNHAAQRQAPDDSRQRPAHHEPA
ncbi:Hypothetical protein A7982_08021 [Minicystis rosea]|nr:Hypothetical protein A7982_08021 [Minicystis rosea]